MSGDVIADRYVPTGLARLVHERHYGGIDPVGAAVLGSVPYLAPPDVALGNGPPQVLHELLRMVAGVDDAVILAQKLLSIVLVDLAELVIYIGDSAVLVRT